MTGFAQRFGGGARLRAAAVAAVLLAFASLAAAFAAAFPLLATDTACRYAPMAEAFAAGNWAEAFHPRFGVGMPVAAGLFRLLFGLDGYAACSGAATFAWALGAWPLFRLAERVFDRRTAYFAAVLYLVCPQPLVWALKGLREPFKMLGLLLMADALLRCRPGGWRNAAEAALGLLLLFTFKCDAIALGGLALAAYAVLDRFGRRTWAVAAAGLAALQPMCGLVHDWTGWWLPAPHYVILLKRLLGA